MGTTATLHERNLGIDFSCGRRIGHAVRKSRFQGARQRLRRIGLIRTGHKKRVGARKVARSGLEA
eukprot:182616-Pyramimonas_sp.AAC.1